MPATKGKVKATFTEDKKTKNTVRFIEDGDEDQHKVGAIYVKKDTVEELGGPDSITVTIEA